MSQSLGAGSSDHNIDHRLNYLPVTSSPASGRGQQLQQKHIPSNCQSNHMAAYGSNHEPQSSGLASPQQFSVLPNNRLLGSNSIPTSQFPATLASNTSFRISKHVGLSPDIIENLQNSGFHDSTNGGVPLQSYQQEDLERQRQQQQYLLPHPWPQEKLQRSPPLQQIQNHEQYQPQQQFDQQVPPYQQGQLHHDPQFQAHHHAQLQPHQLYQPPPHQQYQPQQHQQYQQQQPFQSFSPSPQFNFARVHLGQPQKYPQPLHQRQQHPPHMQAQLQQSELYPRQPPRYKDQSQGQPVLLQSPTDIDSGVGSVPSTPLARERSRRSSLSSNPDIKIANEHLPSTRKQPHTASMHTVAPANSQLGGTGGSGLPSTARPTLTNPNRLPRQPQNLYDGPQQPHGHTGRAGNDDLWNDTLHSNSRNSPQSVGWNPALNPMVTPAADRNFRSPDATPDLSNNSQYLDLQVVQSPQSQLRPQTETQAQWLTIGEGAGHTQEDNTESQPPRPQSVPIDMNEKFPASQAGSRPWSPSEFKRRISDSPAGPSNLGFARRISLPDQEPNIQPSVRVDQEPGGRGTARNNETLKTSMAASHLSNVKQPRMNPVESPQSQKQPHVMYTGSGHTKHPGQSKHRVEEPKVDKHENSSRPSQPVAKPDHGQENRDQDDEDEIVTNCVRAYIKSLPKPPTDQLAQSGNALVPVSRNTEPAILFEQSEKNWSILMDPQWGVLGKIIELSTIKKYHWCFVALWDLFKFFMDKQPSLYDDGKVILNELKAQLPTPEREEQKSQVRLQWVYHLARHYPEKVGQVMKNDLSIAILVVESILKESESKPLDVNTLKRLFPSANPRGDRSVADEGLTKISPKGSSGDTNARSQGDRTIDVGKSDFNIKTLNREDSRKKTLLHYAVAYHHKLQSNASQITAKSADKLQPNQDATEPDSQNHHTSGTAPALAPAITVPNPQLQLVQTILECFPDALLSRALPDGEKNNLYSPYQYRLLTYQQWKKREAQGGKTTAGQNRLEGQNSPAAEAALTDDVAFWADDDEISEYLKEQILRTGDEDVAMSRLQYGSIERAHHLDFAEMEHRDYAVSRQALKHLMGTLKFDSILRYVQISYQLFAKAGNTLVPTDKSGEQEVHEEENLGVGRKDFTRVFEMLKHSKKSRFRVKKILRLIVTDDENTPHCDEVIENLEHFGIESFDWNRVDICSSVLAKGCPDVRELFLYSSGNKAVLRSWSEPEGLPCLKKLETLHLTVWRYLESLETTERYIEEFKTRMAKVHPGVKIASINIELKNRSLDSVRNVVSEDDLANAWLDNMSKFVSFYRTIGDPQNAVRVAIIDDGTEIMEGSEFRDNICDGRSFCTQMYKGHRRTAPYYFSTSGHGTVMAQYILKICPKANLYIARLDHGLSLNGHSTPQPTAASAAKAIRWAIDKKVHIISMSWTMVNTPENNADFQKLENALQDAKNAKILMFGAASDEGYNAPKDRVPFPAKADGVICIGAATRSGHAEGGAEKDGLFFFPGANFDTTRFLPWTLNPSGEYKPHPRFITGSSFATALASGLTALILSCVDIAIEHALEESNESNSTSEPIREAHRKELQVHTTLKDIFRVMCNKGGNIRYIPVAQYFPVKYESLQWDDRDTKTEFYLDVKKIIRPAMDLVREHHQKAESNSKNRKRYQ